MALFLCGKIHFPVDLAVGASLRTRVLEEKNTMNFRKTLSTCMAVLMLAGCGASSSQAAASSESAGIYTPGTYTASAAGRNGDVTVAVTVSADRIEKVEVTEQQETQGVADNALANMPGKIVDAQNTDVEVESGATVTSTAIKNAVDLALAQARGESAPSAEAAEGGTYDVVVACAGGAGLMAAFAAAGNGASVVVLEASASAGGDTLASGGNMLLVDEEFNAKQERNDDSLAKYDSMSADDFEEPWKSDFVTLQQQIEDYRNNGEETGCFGSVEQVIVDQYLNGSGTDLDGNEAHLDYDIVRKSAEETVDIYHTLQEGGFEFKDTLYKANAVSPVNRGNSIIDAEMKLLEGKNVEVLYNTRAAELVVEDGKVTGVKAETADGQEVTYTANKGVVLATGGFAANIEKCAELQRYGTQLSDANGTTNQASIQGDGIWMAEAIGAQTRDMSFLWTVLTGDQAKASISEQGTLLKAAQLAVNQNGERYGDETASMAFQKLTNEEPGTYSYFVGDRQMIDNLNAAKEGFYDDMKNRGIVYEADTLEDAAKAAGVDAETLAKTVEAFNGYVDAESDPDFNRKKFNGKVENGPFVITKMQMAYHLTFGGLVTDIDAHVLDTDGNVIPGLYAAGDVTTGYEGDTHQSGNCLSAVLTMGRIAGNNVSKD